MQQLATALKGLSEPIRLRIINLLKHQELCVCDLIEVLELPQSTISRHLSYLKKGGWILSRKGGKWTYHRRPERPAPFMASVFATLDVAFTNNPVSRNDNDKLAAWLEKKDGKSCD